jgi:hypothetical protein
MKTSVNKQTNALQITMTDYRYLQRELRKIEPKLVAEMRSELKAIGKPAQMAIKRDLRSTRLPLGSRKDPRKGGMRPGFDHSGRMAWDKSARVLNVTKNNYTVDSVFIQANKYRKKAKGYHILRLRANSAVAGLLDMTGRVGKFRDGSLSREHQINLFGRGIVTRRYRINGQGKALAQRLTSRFGQPSRFVYPAVERSREQMINQADVVVSKAVDRINGQLR